MRWSLEKNSNRDYFHFSKMESKLVFHLMIGELNLLTNKTRTRFGGTHCLVKVCRGEDEIDHITKCFGYSAKCPNGGNTKQLAQYLVELNRKRIKKYNLPLVYFKHR